MSILQKTENIMGNKKIEDARIADMRDKIDALTLAGDTASAHKLKQQIHDIYKRRQNKKRAVRIIAVALIAILIIAGMFIYNGFRDKMNSRGDKIKQNLEGLVFSGELKTDNGYAEAVANGTVDPKKTYWDVYEHTTLTFNEKGNIVQHSIHDKKLLAYPEGKKKPKDFYNESDSTIYNFEVFVNNKGVVFLHIKDELYKVVLDDNDVPVKILDYHKKTLELEVK